MDYIIISNIAGIFVFDTDFTLINTIPRTSSIENALEWQDDEIQAISKLKGKVYFLGKKNKKKENITLTQDITKLKNILKENPDFIQLLKQADKAETIKDINTELNDESYKISKSISIIEDIIEALKLLSRRIYEEAEFYNPTLIKEETEDYEKVLTELLENKKTVIGATLTDLDKEHIQNILDQYRFLNQIKEREQNYIEEIMDSFCPNLKAVATPIIAAKLIKKAGTLKQLSFMPSSLVQILGAEKALFRHIKTNAKPPKYGYLISHPIIMDSKDKGKAARLLASKITIAARTDYFSKGKNISDDLLKELEAKL